MNFINSRNTIITFGEAIELAKQGIPVSNVNWGFLDRLTGHLEPLRVPADKIWSRENRKAALRNADKSITVRPYLTKVDGQHIDNWLPSAKDIYDSWMLSSTYPRLKAITLVDDEDQAYKLEYELLPDQQPHHPFWMLYDQEMIGYFQLAIMIGGDIKTCKRNLLLIESMNLFANYRNINTYPQELKNDLVDPSTNSGEFLVVGEEENLGDSSDDIGHAIVVDNEIDDALERLKEHDYPINIFIDSDSLNGMDLFNGENALEYVKGRIVTMSNTNPNINWVSFSLKEEIDNSILDLPEAADDETYALKAD